MKSRAVKASLPGFEGWGSLSFEESSKVRLEIGPLCLWIARAEHEWLVQWQQAQDPMLDMAQVVRDVECPAIKDEDGVLRFATSWEGFRLRIYPSLADRGVVVRPETPTILGPHDEVAFYVSTPLWLCLETDTGIPIMEVPTFRPSDTWFGDFQDGELAYASRTAGRVSLSDVRPYHARALTKVSIRNEANEPMMIERINIPVPLLTLFQDSEDRFWTESLSLIAQERGSLVQLQLSPSAPKEAKNAERVTMPRTESSSNVLVRALHRLLG